MKLQTLLALLTSLYDIHGNLNVELTVVTEDNDGKYDYTGPLSGLKLSSESVVLRGIHIQ